MKSESVTYLPTLLHLQAVLIFRLTTTHVALLHFHRMNVCMYDPHIEGIPFYGAAVNCSVYVRSSDHGAQ